MLSDAPRSPTGRGISDVSERIERLAVYERWRSPTQIDFEAIVGKEAWEHYWGLCEAVNDELKEAQAVADSLSVKVAEMLARAKTEWRS
jgi:hypothetical protein